MAVVIIASGVIYLYRTRGKVGPDVIEQPASAPGRGAQAGTAAAPARLATGAGDPAGLPR